MCVASIVICFFYVYFSYFMIFFSDLMHFSFHLMRCFSIFRLSLTLSRLGVLFKYSCMICCAGKNVTYDNNIYFSIYIYLYNQRWIYYWLIMMRGGWVTSGALFSACPVWNLFLFTSCRFTIFCLFFVFFCFFFLKFILCR